jgi:hypothetical protein
LVVRRIYTAQRGIEEPLATCCEIEVNLEGDLENPRLPLDFICGDARAYCD